MPLYEYYCRTCEQKFELLRPMSRADEDAVCPAGHTGAQRVMSMFASFAKDADGTVTPVAGSSACSACAGGYCATCGVSPNN